MTLEREAAVLEIAGEYEQAGLPRFDRAVVDYPAAVAELARTERTAPRPSLVPSTFYLAELEDGRIVGTLRLRHALSESLWQDGGHIGYDVRPSMRNRGYATRMLALALREARERGFFWMLLTVDPGNAPSIRVIEKNGGVPIGRAHRSGNLRYRIDVR